MTNMTDKESITVPLVALSIETQVLLSNLLNPTKIIATDANLPRDWRGIAEIASVPSEMMALFENKGDPFKEVLNFLSSREGVRIGIEDLRAFLAVIDRYDVLDDASYLFDRDSISYVTKINDIKLDRNVENIVAKQDSRVLTYEDALRAQNGLALPHYDAFILHADEDAEFASDIIERMEGEYNLKLCSKDRDLLPGLRFEHEVIGNMIEARCNRLLVIFSPSFLESNANQFLVSYAQAVALDTRCRKIIPCVYKRCELPVSVRYSFCIDYNRSGKLWNFWDKLSQSLIATKDVPSPEVKLKDSAHLSQPDSNSKNQQAEWWEASKPHVLSELDSGHASIPNSMILGNETNDFSHFTDDQGDAISIHSQAHLLPSSTSRTGSKSPKWFSKMINPMRQKKSKEKTKERPIAE